MNKPRASQPPQPKLLTSRDKYENSYWMEQLPAHIWVQNSENTVIYSNRLPVNRPAVKDGRYCRGRKINCHRDFMGRENSCPCCPHQRVTSTLQAESCLCRRDESTYQVYHFPFALNGEYHGNHPPLVLKIEIDIAAMHFAGKKTGNSIVVQEEAASGETSSSRLVKICSTCKKVRDQTGAWSPVENYFDANYGIKFSHGMCEECACRLYPEIWPDNS
jgi:hypothetical protein